MACGNNHIGRADVGATITTEPDREALERQIRQIAATSTGWRTVSPDNPDYADHAASTYTNETGKIDVYTDERGMPRLGNVYPHVHEFSTPGGDDGVIASLDKGDHRVGRTFAPDTSGKDRERVAAVEAARAVVATKKPPPPPAAVTERIEALRDALKRPHHP